jgi:hypothetical protein
MASADAGFEKENSLLRKEQIFSKRQNFPQVFNRPI